MLFALIVMQLWCLEEEFCWCHHSPQILRLKAYCRFLQFLAQGSPPLIDVALDFLLNGRRNSDDLFFKLWNHSYEIFKFLTHRRKYDLWRFLLSLRFVIKHWRHHRMSVSYQIGCFVDVDLYCHVGWHFADWRFADWHFDGFELRKDFASYIHINWQVLWG